MFILLHCHAKHSRAYCNIYIYSLIRKRNAVISLQVKQIRNWHCPNTVGSVCSLQSFSIQQVKKACVWSSWCIGFVMQLRSHCHLSTQRPGIHIIDSVRVLDVDNPCVLCSELSVWPAASKHRHSWFTVHSYKALWCKFSKPIFCKMAISKF